jgi:ribose/xylose/arabinose/galactoside ABC-type transport system permease subunit
MGLPVRRSKLLVYALSGFLAGLAGAARSPGRSPASCCSA